MSQAHDPGRHLIEQVPERSLLGADRAAYHRLLEKAPEADRAAFRRAGIEFMHYAAHRTLHHVQFNVADGRTDACARVAPAVTRGVGATIVAPAARAAASGGARGARDEGPAGYIDFTFDFGKPTSFDNQKSLVVWRDAALALGWGGAVHGDRTTREGAFTTEQVVLMTKRVEAIQRIAAEVMARTNDVRVARNGCEVLSFVTYRYRALVGNYRTAYDPRLQESVSRWSARRRQRTIADGEAALREAAAYVAVALTTTTHF